MSDTVRISYLCLQATHEGQASFAHVHEIIRGLERRGVDVALFQPSYVDTESPGAHGRAREFWRVQGRLMRASRDADLIYVRAHFAALPTVIWAASRKIPVIQEVNGSYEDLFAAWPWTRHLAHLFRHLMRMQYRSASALITVTTDLAGWLSAETGNPEVVTIPNGADTATFVPDATNAVATPARYALFFGAFAPWQGIGTMLAAKKHPLWPSDVSLVMAGDGMERPLIVAAAAQDPSIVYVGVVPYHDMPGLIAGSIVSLSSQSGMAERCSYGMSPLKLYETLACATPVIVTDYPGQADLVRELDAGLVVTPESPEAMAEAVAVIASNPIAAAAMGERGREAVHAHHTWDLRAEETWVLILKTIGSRSR